MADYEFRYSPLTGRLTGKQMIEQTEQAINQLSSLVDSAAGQVEIISTLANEANENAATANEANENAATALEKRKKPLLPQAGLILLSAPKQMPITTMTASLST